MENPWKNITWHQLYADCDEEIFNSTKFSDKIQIDTLPEPFAGNVNSNVICLNGNPGRTDSNFTEKNKDNDTRNDKNTVITKEYKHLFYNELKENLNLRYEEFFWLSEKIASTEHDGIGWWQKMTKSLQKELGHKPQLFVLEFFPYHSSKMFAFPSLPSDEFRNYLLRKAMDENKLIVIMRAQNKWEGIKENSLGEDLKNYENKIILHNPQRVYLTKNNMGEENWKKFLLALSK